MERPVLILGHAQADHALAERYRAAFTAQGFVISLSCGNHADSTMLASEDERALAHCSGLIVLLTEASASAVRIQLMVAAIRSLAQEKSRQHPALLLVRITPCSIPLVLRGIPTIEAVNRLPEEMADEIAQALARSNMPTGLRSHDTRTFAIANQEGKVGKTTTAINLAAYLANAGRSVLLVDTDAKSRATTGLGVDPHSVGLSIYELLVQDGISPKDAIRAELRPNLSLLPAKVDLYAADIELVYIDNREFRLKRILEQVKGDYDFILIDCPSSLHLLTINALVAADGVILPLECEYFALEGMQQLLKTIHLVRSRLNPSIFLFGIVLTMFDAKTNLAKEVVDEISQHFPKERFQTIIPRNVRLSEAPMYGLTVLEHDGRSPGALAYKQLAEEVIERAAVMEGIHA